MHPADVAAFVAAGVDELRAQVADQPRLGIKSIHLHDDVELLVRFESSTSESDRQQISVSAPALPNDVAMLAGGMAVPIIGTRRAEKFILKLDFTDWNSQPPTALLLDASGNELPNERWPRDSNERGIVEGHPDFGQRKFFCREGTREFHTHPQHEDSPWDAIREGMTLHGIVIGLLRDLTERWTFR
jgi:hypothetical protein